MEGFSIDLLTEQEAIATIESTRTVVGQVKPEEYPVLLVRGEDGEWLIYDY